MFTIAAALFCFSNVHSVDQMQDIYQHASQLINEEASEETHQRLFEFYSREIEKIDFETLKKNPELIFRRGLAWFEVMDAEESIQKINEGLVLLQNDFQFVMNYSSPTSRLFLAAQEKNNYINHFLQASVQSVEGLIRVNEAFKEEILRQWATNPLATGKELRENVFLHLKRSPDASAAFFDFMLLFEGDPDLALGYIKPYDMEVLGIVPQEDGGATLLYVIMYDSARNVTFASQTEL